MARCSALAVALLAAVPCALAQMPRTFPATALRGDLVVQAPPEILLNGTPARLSPGARIRGANNMLLLSGRLVGQPLRVHYTFDTLGLVHDVWVLTAAEAARTPWPTTPQQLREWSFNPDLQTWSKP